MRHWVIELRTINKTWKVKRRKCRNGTKNDIKNTNPKTKTWLTHTYCYHGKDITVSSFNGVWMQFLRVVWMNSVIPDYCKRSWYVITRPTLYHLTRSFFYPFFFHNSVTEARFQTGIKPSEVVFTKYHFSLAKY